MDLKKQKRKAPGGQKGQKGQKGQTTSTKRQKTAPTPIPSRQVHVDSLPWQTIDVPEMWGDAEGFYGLEEVSGVKVVKSGEIIEFHSAVPSSTQDASAPEEEEEFGGFDDEPVLPTEDDNVEPEPSTSSPSKSKPEKPSESKGTKKEKQPPKKKQKSKDKKGELSSVGFSALQDAPETGGEEGVDVSAWEPLDLSPMMLSAISALKFSTPTPIQTAAIPQILAGHDAIGKAATGSGKTLAFGIPIVEEWLKEKESKESKEESKEDSDSEEEGAYNGQKTPTALILAPTRELAKQLVTQIKALCSTLPSQPYICSVTGGLSVYKQQRELQKADIVVGTPGRLWEVLSDSTDLLTAFKTIKFLVVDEADRLLSEGHFAEAGEILAALDRYVAEEGEDSQIMTPRQTLVFSATFDKNLQHKLSNKKRNNFHSTEESMEYLLTKLNFREENPKFLDMNPIQQMASGLKEGLLECGAMEKDLYLYALLLHHPGSRTLVFTNGIDTVRRVTPMIKNLNLKALPLHGDMIQKQRLRSLEKFAASTPSSPGILIATDVAARGLDIKGIDLIIHYHVPRQADEYIHRSGRTARASAEGRSIMLCSPEEVNNTRGLIARVHAKNSARTSTIKDNRFYIRTVDIDRRICNRLKPRLSLAKKIADALQAKDKGAKEDGEMRKMAEDLGLEYDSDSLARASTWGGKGSMKKKRMEESRATTKGELAAWRAQLRELLGKRVNAGVSEKYITSGGLDVDALLQGGAKGEFLGTLDMGFD